MYLAMQRILILFLSVAPKRLSVAKASYDRQQFDRSSVKPANNEVIVATQVWF